MLLIVSLINISDLLVEKLKRKKRKKRKNEIESKQYEPLFDILYVEADMLNRTVTCLYCVGK